MSIAKVNLTVSVVKGSTKKTVYKNTWDGDLGDWMEIGGEIAGAIESDYDKIIVEFEQKKKIKGVQSCKKL